MPKEVGFAKGTSLSLSVSVSVSVSLRCFQLQDGRLYVIGRVISGRSRSKLLSGHALPDMYKENCKRFRKEAKRLLLNSLHPKPGRAVRSRSPLLPRFFNFSYFSSRASSMCLPFSGPLSLSLSPSLFRYTPLCLPRLRRRARNGDEMEKFACLFVSQLVPLDDRSW